MKAKDKAAGAKAKPRGAPPPQRRSKPEARKPSEERVLAAYAAGRREGARLTVAAQADSLDALAGRLASYGDAAQAVREAVAILRDAAGQLDPNHQSPRQRAAVGEERREAAAEEPVRRPPETRPKPPQRAPESEA